MLIICFIKKYLYNGFSYICATYLYLNNSTINLDAFKITDRLKKVKVNKVHSYVVTPANDPSGVDGKHILNQKMGKEKRYLQ
ncbi:hypothetical protein BCM20_004462 [Clostridium beijerinckii]|uniref:hypothetical protein n=1 Tax=Clostridium beijerinckii TaxID=1520 RepID=UPI001493ECFD|nr:hypothetical protein [Clostridium beijerinckii]NYC04456.1 hypothetical protein [Clostridium beijerinckii]